MHPRKGKKDRTTIKHSDMVLMREYIPILDPKIQAEAQRQNVL